MKKNYPFNLMILLVLVAFSSGCSKETLDISPEALQNFNTSSQSIGIMSEGDGQWDLLGHGYDLIGEFAAPSSARLPVIDVARLNSEQLGRVQYSPSEMSYARFRAGENAEDYARSVSADLKVTMGLKLFRGSISAYFKDSTAYSSKYIYSTFDHQIQKKAMYFSADNELLRSYLTATFIMDLQTSTIPNLISRYGTHVLSNIVLGAKLQVAYQSETSELNKISAAKAGLNLPATAVFVGINTEITSNSTESNENFSQKLYYKIYGGNASIPLIKEVPLGQTLPKIDLSQWQASVTKENAQLIDIREDGLIPIYDLVADPVKRIAIMEYVNRHLIANQVKVSNLTNNLYRCFRSKHNDRLLTTNPGEVSGIDGWQVEGYFGSIYKQSSKPGLVPLHRFLLKSTNTHLFTANRNEVSSLHGNYEGIVGYMHSSQETGTIPIYRYNNKGVHMYSIDLNELGWGSSTWVYEGIIGYILP